MAAANSRPEALALTPRSSNESSRNSSRSSTPTTPTTARAGPFLRHSSSIPSPTSSPDREPDAFNGRPSASLPDDDDDAASEDVETLGEGSPMLRRWSTDPATGSRPLLPAKADDEDRDDLLQPISDDDDDGLGSAGPSSSALSFSGQWESTRSDGSPGGSSSWAESPLTRGQKRKVYGGGRHGEAMEGGGMSAGEVAGLILAGTLSPTPILLPHAAALLGLPLFLPLLFLTAALSWFSYVVLGVESRYVGSRSWPSLTSAVFPHRFKLHRLGETTIAILVLLSSLVRGIVGVVAASEIVVDLLLPAGGRRWWERVAAISVISGVWALAPTLIFPFVRSPNLRRRPTTSNSASAFSRLPAYIAFLFWPLALLILGVRLKTLNSLPSPPLPRAPLLLDAGGAGGGGTKDEVMGLSLWGGISILVFSLSAHQDSFRYLTSLARPPSTATRGSSSRSSPRSNNDDSSGGGGGEGRRNQWPLASALGVGCAALVQMGWGLVGYLGIEEGGREGNVLASRRLPRGDGWLALVRVLVLVAVLIALEGSVETAYSRVRKGIELAAGSGSAVVAGKRSGAGKPAYTRVGGAGGGEEERKGWDWRTTLARVAVWAAVLAISVVVTTRGEQGEGLVSVVEIAGCIGSTLLGFLVPSVYFIALFHLRRPRSIFVSDPSAPMFASDTLLMRKEREVQRRLSGRRIWMDVLVFGGLLPFGTVVMLRGCIALATKED